MKFDDPNFKINNAVHVNNHLVNQLNLLNQGLIQLKIPLMARYAFVAIASSIQASITLPSSQMISAIIAVGGAAVIAYYWGELSPVFDKIIELFKTVFYVIVNSVIAGFEFIRIRVAYTWLNFNEAGLTNSTRTHMEPACIDRIRKQAPVRVYYSPKSIKIMAIFDVPSGLVCWANDLLSKDSTYSQKYDRRVDLTGFKMLVLNGFDKRTNQLNQVFHAHLRWNGKIDREIAHYRFKEQLTYEVLPLPVKYDSTYERGSDPGLGRDSDKQLLR